MDIIGSAKLSAVGAAVLGPWACLPAWGGAGKGAPRFWLLAVFVVRGVSSLLRSRPNFRFRRPGWALLEVEGPWLLIALPTAVRVIPDRWAPWLLVPHRARVGFAAWRNPSVVGLNGPYRESTMLWPALPMHPAFCALGWSGYGILNFHAER